MVPNYITPIAITRNEKKRSKSSVVFWTFIAMAERYGLNTIQTQALIKILNEPMCDPMDLISLKDRLGRILLLLGIDEDIFMSVYEDFSETVMNRNRVTSN